jgi:D-lactate dehydrogenase
LCACCRRFSLYEPVAFTSLFLAPALDFQRLPRSVALHVPCTSKQAPGLEQKFTALAEQCADSVTPTGVAAYDKPMHMLL